MTVQFSRVDVAAALVCVLVVVITGYAVDWEAIELENRIVCGTNLKGLGTAQVVYANDYDDAYAVQGEPGGAHWTTKTSGWANPTKDWSGDNDLTVGANLYLLVREADASPKSFVCPSSSQKEFDGSNPMSLDLTELWDFGSVDYQNTGPKNCVSYSYQHPFGRFAANGTKSATFAMMADKNPWMDSALRKGTPSGYDWKTRVGYIVWNAALRGDRDWLGQVGNSQAHLREGQNTLYGDGHSSYELWPDVGVKHDNIYTPQGMPNPYNEDYCRIGQMPDPYGIGYGEPRTSMDSFLVNDDEINPCFEDQPGDMNGDCTVDVGDLAELSRYWMESTRVED